MNQAATLIATVGLIYLGVIVMDRLAYEQQQREPS